LTSGSSSSPDTDLTIKVECRHVKERAKRFGCNFSVILNLPAEPAPSSSSRQDENKATNMFPHRTVRALLVRLLCCVVLCMLAAGVARAQDAPAPAYLAVVEGEASLDRDGEVIEAVQNMPLVPGDGLSTRAGRVEIRFPDGTGVEVGEYSQIDVLSPTRVRVIAGSIDRLEPLPENTASASYLPQGLRTYGAAFDQYGSWQYTAPYGHVWYPRVAVGWRPYYRGYWEPVPSYGWTWIGADSWSWPTHHYGRWGYAHNAWFWIPGRTFSAAWVSWGAADGYVSWCPLGFDNRAVFALSTGYSRGWNGWTVLPRTHFGVRGVRVDRFAVAPHRLPPQTGFVTQRSAPRVDSRESVVGSRESRAGSPRSDAGYAVPRQAPHARPTTDYRRPTTDYRQPTTDHAVPRRDYPATVPGTTVPPPSSTAPQVTPRYAPGRVAPPQTQPQVTPRSAPGRPSTTDYRRPSTTDYRPPTTDYRPAPQYAPPRVMPRYNPAPAAPATVPRAAPAAPYDSRPRTSDQRPSTTDYRRPSTTDYRPPTTDYRPPTTDYRPPTTDYRAAPRVSPPPPPAPPPPPPPPPASATPTQRSAPAGSAPAGRAAPRSSGEGRAGGRQRG
jgi:hypothetical protein